MPRSPTTRWPRQYQWWGWDDDCTCNLCGIWRPGPHADERLLAMEDFYEFAFTASLYRNVEEGRALLRRWLERHGGDFEHLRILVRLLDRDRTPEEIAQHEQECAERLAVIEAEEREQYEREERSEREREQEERNPEQPRE